MKQKILDIVKRQSIPIFKGFENRLVSCQQEGSGHWALVIKVADLSPDQRKSLAQYLNKALQKHLSGSEFVLRFISDNIEPSSDAPPKNSPSKPKEKLPPPRPIPGVKHVIAVASGKGGVGKSAVSALLACGFDALGLKTALLDADIYGPSQAHMFGLTGRPEITETTGKVNPLKAGNIAVMSFSFFMEPNQPVVWRGPIVNRLLQQFFFDVNWGSQDILIVDLPPGTGDIPLSMVQSIALSGVLMVTTPQQVAALDVVKGAAMFQAVHLPLLGIVENMSHFNCPSCQTTHPVFQSGGGNHVARCAKTKVIGRLPLDPNIGQFLDEGRAMAAFGLTSINSDIQQLAQRLCQSTGIPQPKPENWIKKLKRMTHRASVEEPASR